MADVKISGLPASTTPLSGSEVLPVVQGGVTKKVSVDNLTAGKAISTAGVTDTSLTASKPVFTDANKKLTSNGTLATDQGGTGLTSFTNQGVPYATSTSALTTSTAFLFDGRGIGLGTATSPWGSGNRSVDFGSWVAVGEGEAGAMSWNAYYDGTNWKRKLGFGVGSGLFLVGDQYVRARYAAAGSAGSTISWSDSFRTDGNGDTIFSGNVVISTSGKGIDFSAATNAAGMTSELLSDYEEGTWTPTITSAAGTITSYTVGTATYTKVGRLVTASTRFTITNAGTGAGALEITLPFTAGTSNHAGSVVETALTGDGGRTWVSNSATSMFVAKYNNTTYCVTNYVITATATYSV